MKLELFIIKKNLETMEALMSRTAKKMDRVEGDQYQTPVSAVEPILPYIDFTKVNSFLEPCVGEGSILNTVSPLLKKTCEIFTADVINNSDYFKTKFAAIDLIITNPPFSQALPFLEKSICEAKTVIYLLRLNFLASQKRKEFWNKYTPNYLFVLSRRPCFVWTCKTPGCKSKYSVGNRVCDKCGGKVGPGTDATEYAWFVWDSANLIDENADRIMVL